jgi:hypothetical protein
VTEGRVELSVPRGDSVFAARLRFWLLTGFLAGASLGVLGVLVVTQTRWGHEQVLGFTLRAASEQLDGTLTIDRLSGNLLTGARLYGISLRGPDDDLFLRADSAYVEYNLRTIAGDEIVLDRLVLFDAEVYLRQLPGDTLWNYDRIFGDTIPRPELEEPAEPRRPLIVRAASLSNGIIQVEMPWEPDPEETPAEQRREVAAALADTSQIIVREVPGGYLRTMRFSEVTADLANVVSAPDEIGGTSLQVAGFSGVVGIFREPFLVQQLEGDLSYRDALLRFRVPSLRLPGSQVAAHGRIEFGDEEGPRLDITVRGEQVAFADLRPIHPPLPEEGGGSLDLVIETRPEGTLYLARNLDVSAPGTRLRGSFGLIVNDAFRFVEVDLAADPLRVATIERILPIEFPVEGLHIGGVTIRQPAT